MTGRKLQRVEDYIISAIDRIEAYTRGVDRNAFDESKLLQDAVIRNFEIIGEAANEILTVDPAFAQRYPELPLDLAYRMRNAMVHGYDTVNVTTIWNTIESDLLVLKQQIANIRRA